MAIFSVLIILGLLIFSAILSGIETAVVASSPGRMQKLKAEGSTKAYIVLKLLKMKDRVISTLLVVNSISNTVCTTVAASLFIGIYGEDIGTIISSSIMSILIIVFAEVIPKAIAVAKAERISLYVSYYLNIMLKLLRPVNYILDITVKIFCFIFRINLKETLSGADELRGVIEHQHQEGNVFKEDREMLDGILDISAMSVSSIMVHRSNMKTIDASLSIKKIVAKALSTTHTRIPVFKGTEDNIIGVLHIKNLLKSLHENNFNYDKIALKDFIIEPWFIPCNSLVNQQLHEFKRRKTHFALVVDEYGEIKGLVTLEDVLEEIVGQIDDEHDKPLNKIESVSATEFILHGGISVRDLNREMGWDLEDENAHTIAGFIIAHEKRLPEQGESFVIQDIKFTIQRRINNHIKSIIADTSGLKNTEPKKD